ncbi:Gfo/Idh/MocA family protein [Maribellus maritimus]|uniref:Gfo/Idh/MocA family protein n=1 Tax=Maribellus maritimus TaxID=2870838 RepID=UPI001EEB5813|nr:Gfo/Idh/MocA family oxidoreductase [Maribellus maritimus]MCG6189711.1 Gfo/Idh/MocA family oxidoreductase [Maribellus maritimus]
MERRKFFFIAGTGAAGLALSSSCKGTKTDSLSGSEETVKSLVTEEPSYRKVVKKTFRNKYKSANDMITVALIGAGGWGTNLITQASDVGENMRVKYVCDVDDTRGGFIIKELEKKQNFKPIRIRDMRKVFDDKEVDAVFIATPEHWHALATIWACQAGKDVYVEKPVSHNIVEGQRMIEAGMKYERIIQSGTLNRSAAEALTAKNYIDSGELGEIAAVKVKSLYMGPVPFNEKENSDVPDTIDWDMWLGPAALVPYNITRNKSWTYYWAYGGGEVMTNQVIHQLDLARFVLGDPGFPSSVYCLGGRYFFDDKRDIPDYQMTTFDFGKYVMTIEAGQCTPYMVPAPPEVRYGNIFPKWNTNAFHVEILGTKRMMFLGRMGSGWQVFDKGGEVVAEQTGYYPLKRHLQNFFDCVRSRKRPNGDIVESHKSTVLVHLANMSYRVGCKYLDFSPEYETIINDNKAQDLAFYQYRKGFEMPKEI